MFVLKQVNFLGLIIPCCTQNIPLLALVTEEEAFREIVKKRIQEEADQAKEGRMKKKRLNDAVGIEEGKRAGVIVNDVAIGRTRGRGAEVEEEVLLL